MQLGLGQTQTLATHPNQKWNLSWTNEGFDQARSWILKASWNPGQVWVWLRWQTYIKKNVYCVIDAV